MAAVDVGQHPCTNEEWERVTEAAFALVNTTATKDDPRYPAAATTMHSLIAELRAKYGDHPVLLETAADFEDDVSLRIALYSQAIERAQVLGLSALSIRMAIAAVLIDDCARSEDARAHLEACVEELHEIGDDHDHAEHAELLSRCQSQSTTLTERKEV